MIRYLPVYTQHLRFCGTPQSPRDQGWGIFLESFLRKNLRKRFLKNFPAPETVRNIFQYVPEMSGNGENDRKALVKQHFEL